MVKQIRRWFFNLTPEKTHAWTLAFYPALVAVGVGYLLITHAEITPEIVGLFVGLLTAGSLRAAIKSDGSKNGDSNAKSSSGTNSGDGVHNHRDPELEENDRSRPNDSRRRFDLRNWVYIDPIFSLS